MPPTDTLVTSIKPSILKPAEVRRLIRGTVRLAGRPDAPPVTVAFVDDATITDLNARFRGKPKPTDVLSFPEDGGDSPEAALGDIAISLDTARRQAGRKRHSLARELAILIIHGTLHLLGYDHEVDDGEMNALERRVRRQLLVSQGRA